MQEEQPQEAAEEPAPPTGASDCGPGVVSSDSQNLSDVDAFKILLEMKMKKRQKQPSLPGTVTELVTEEGSKVYVVGTAHFSDDSKRDVVKTIQEVQPDVVVVELCQYRVSMLKMDEKTLLKEAKEINLEKLQQAVKQNGVMSGLMQMLLLKVSAHITEQLGMAPGGEFREAFKEASKVPFCKFHLGDRPIPVTFKRAIAALSFWQKVKLAWGLCFLSDPISKDDVEKCKQKDLLEQMMAEMIGEFPDLHRTIVSERDIYLTYMLRQAAKRLELPRASEAEPRKSIPSVVVGVVGMGHVPGIEKNWTTDLNIQEIMSVPPPSISSKVSRFVVKAAFFGLMCYGFYRECPAPGRRQAVSGARFRWMERTKEGSSACEREELDVWSPGSRTQHSDGNYNSAHVCKAPTNTASWDLHNSHATMDSWNYDSCFTEEETEADRSSGLPRITAGIARICHPLC
ncbi:traB domain-containing protein isoform X3 [Monodelphis domestica]|nr:traB domain-containing protein isoform X3 [Monodelphis domestica]XP_056653538.1 traB domain-containing protein isoform X3 [Monodelphis domestica]XP_056653539.1 traB domain-containing protein isoform X3 [Monodelphis domestica]XP_056653540.1 traB domain-containing protein isoform X3 [Monodelphis domestica]XP_056653541.1 traB domain-containing protein isoform X3 [Monodelphis domestica]XP_056653543.1 traB domain-containing protein isoform X3 [Monodelphis domestica]XP_056653544.1 traB domain-co